VLHICIIIITISGIVFLNSFKQLVCVRRNVFFMRCELEFYVLEKLNASRADIVVPNTNKELRGLSPRAKYTD
jgi:hypothetical protein